MCASKIATPEKSFASDPGELPDTAMADDASAVQAPGVGGRAALLALNLWPLLHVVGSGLLLILPSWSLAARVGASIGALWILPPLVCRILIACCPLRDGSHAWGSRTFWSWWVSLQLQTIFLRLPFLEEILRLVPGLYSNWLRLWGSSVGRLTYWSPGVEVTDRPLLAIGDDVVLGGKVRLGSHVLRRRSDGVLELVLGRIDIGHRCAVGAQSTVGPGVRLEDGEFTHAFFLAPPFSHWRGGQRVRHHPISSSSSPSTP
jgi:hypothetical protein